MKFCRPNGTLFCYFAFCPALKCWAIVEETAPRPDSEIKSGVLRPEAQGDLFFARAKMPAAPLKLQ